MMIAFASGPLNVSKRFQRALTGISASLILVISSGLFAQADDNAKAAKQAEIDKYSERIKSNANDAEAFVLRGNLYFQLADYKNAVSDFSEYINLTKSQKPGGFCSRAVAKISLLDNEGAIADYTEAIKLDPNLAQAYLSRAQLIFSMKDTKRFSMASDDCKAAIRLDFRPSRAYLTLSSMKLDTGDDQGAIADATEAIKIEPKLGDAYTNRAIAKVRTGDVQGALEDAKTYEQLVPDDHEVHLTLGDTLRKYKHYSEACQEYKAIIKFKPELVSAWTSMGDCYNQTGDLVEAEKCFRQAASLDARSFLGVSNVGNMLRKQGKFAEAKEWFDRARRLPTPEGDDEKDLDGLIKLNDQKDKS